MVWLQEGALVAHTSGSPVCQKADLVGFGRGLLTFQEKRKNQFRSVGLGPDEMRALEL